MAEDSDKKIDPDANVDYGWHTPVGPLAVAGHKIMYVPTVENFLRGPAATHFAEIAKEAARHGYEGADAAADVFAHRWAARKTQARQLSMSMKRFSSRNPLPSVSSTPPSAPAATSQSAKAAATRLASESTKEYVARKIVEARAHPSFWKGVVQAARKGASGLTNLIIGAPGTRIAHVKAGGAWTIAIHGLTEGVPAAYHLAKDLMDPENRKQVQWSHWYDYLNPLPLKGGINPDRFQHELINSGKRLVAGVVTFGYADWGQGDYDPMSDATIDKKTGAFIDGSDAARLAYAMKGVQDIRDQWYRERRAEVEKLTTYTPGSDVGEFIRAAQEGAKRMTFYADTREKQLPPRVHHHNGRAGRPTQPEDDGILYARELIGQSRRDARAIETGAIASVRAAYKDDQAGYRKLLEDQVDREILPVKFPQAFPNGLTYDPKRVWSDTKLRDEVQGYRDKLLSDPGSEYAILGFKRRED